MWEVLNNLWPQLQGSLDNQFLSGGLVLGAITGIIAYGRRLPARLWQLFLFYYTISVEVTSDNKAFREMLVWLDAQPYSKRSRRLNVQRIYMNNENRTILVPSRGNHWFIHDGTVIWLNRKKEAGTSSSNGPADMSSLISTEIIDITILGRDRAKISRILAEAEEMCRDKESNLQQIYNYSGSWDYTLKAPRALGTVFLPAEASDLLSDMEGFLANRPWYDSRGIPFHRGYLFHGPPGGGKTSAAQALAASLKIPLYCMNLAAVGSDAALQNAFQRLPDETPFMLLIEDIDTAMPNREQDKEKKLFSLGTLLNMLDGVQSKEQMLLVMTTNHPERLDPALIRPGRVDRLVEFPPASAEQIDAAIRLYFPDNYATILSAAESWETPISMAKVQEHLRQFDYKEKDGTKKLGIEGAPSLLQQEMLTLQTYVPREGRDLVVDEQSTSSLGMSNLRGTNQRRLSSSI